ncbi:hypothetical protein C8F01DRAFT_1375122 [Mycena amicta]|nr:hypothetical protein C8F01DRAFT_1375122 [Mycena amicta]
MSSNDEPRLPRELEREILYTAALLHPLTIPTFLRVARRVLIWVEPLLYRVLTIGGPSGVAQLNAASSKPPAFLTRAVRCLVLDGGCDYKAASSTLSLCNGITALAVAGRDSRHQLLPIIAAGAMPLQRMAGYLSDIMHITDASRPEEIAAHPVFHCLTHLDFFETVSDTTPAMMGLLLCLPRLTHLVFYYRQRLDQICEWVEPVLKNCRTLHILVMLYYDRSDPTDDSAAQRDAMGEVPESLRDPRLVLCSYASHLWYEGALDGPNYWTLAEDFVARKRRREVDDVYFHSFLLC